MRPTAIRSPPQWRRRRCAAWHATCRPRYAGRRIWTRTPRRSAAPGLPGPVSAASAWPCITSFVIPWAAASTCPMRRPIRRFCPMPWPITPPPRRRRWPAFAPPSALRRGKLLAAALFDLALSCGAQMRLADLGLREADLDLAAELALAAPYPNPRPLDRAGIRRLLEDAYHGCRPASRRASMNMLTLIRGR